MWCLADVLPGSCIGSRGETGCQALSMFFWYDTSEIEFGLRHRTSVNVLNLLKIPVSGPDVVMWIKLSSVIAASKWALVQSLAATVPVQFLDDELGNAAADVLRAFISLSHARNTSGISDSWLKSGPALALVAI